MPTYILANLKSNQTYDDACQWFETFLDHYNPNINTAVIIAPPTLYLIAFRNILEQRATSNIHLAAQDVSPFTTGPYTGEVAASMLKGVVEFAMVGHSERRRHFKETHAEIAQKIDLAQNADITPILCLDTPYAKAQISALAPHNIKGNLIIGYGPVVAINQENPPSPKDQQDWILTLKKHVGNLPILYGGSINAKNSTEYLQLSGISGLMVGSSCLNPQEFATICTQENDKKTI